MSPKKTGNTLSCSLLMYRHLKIPADAKCAQRAAACGTALRAVKVLTSCQILPEPLPLTLPEGAPATDSSALNTLSENLGVASAVPPAADVPT